MSEAIAAVKFARCKIQQEQVSDRVEPIHPLPVYTVIKLIFTVFHTPRCCSGARVL